jgi:type I restriction enzyme M protein
LLDSFRTRLNEVGLLDRYALDGAIAGWWQDARYELMALSSSGFKEVVDGWVEMVETMLLPERDPRTGGARNRTGAERRQAYDHKVVARIAPGFLRDLTEADARKAELDAKLKAALASAGEDGEEEDRQQLSEDDIKRLKRERTKANAAVKALEESFYPLEDAKRSLADGSDPTECEALKTELDEMGRRVWLGDVTPPGSPSV